MRYGNSKITSLFVFLFQEREEEASANGDAKEAAAANGDEPVSEDTKMETNGGN